MAQKPILFPPPAAEQDSFFFERALTAQGYCRVAGTDEAGRGPLAGPVVAAAVILPHACDYTLYFDSKQLSAARRRELLAELRRIEAPIGVGICEAAEIDRLNILRASLLAMKKALEALPASPDFLLVDGKFPVPVALPQQPLVKGDSRSATIAAASIVAKELRDELMAGYHERYPQYNFARHKGYPTAEHRQLLRRHGPCAIHRRTFKGVRELLTDDGG